MSSNCYTTVYMIGLLNHNYVERFVFGLDSKVCCCLFFTFITISIFMILKTIKYWRISSASNISKNSSAKIKRSSVWCCTDNHFVKHLLQWKCHEYVLRLFEVAYLWMKIRDIKCKLWHFFDTNSDKTHHMCNCITDRLIWCHVDD